jgi:3-oxoacyl-[acyl-carrier protein] reductase
VRVCLVSGAANGIGRATLRLFAERGYSCIGIDKDDEAIARVASELPSSGRVEFVSADLVKEDNIDLSGVDALDADEIELTLVNNVGGSLGVGSFASSSWEGFAESFAFNVKPLHTLTRACLGIMRRSGYGRIVNVSSVSGRTALRQVGPEYTAAKAAVIGLSRHMALELADDGIRVNTVCPGVIGTNRILDRWATRSAETNRRVLSGIPLGRLGEPEEVADAIFFLAASATYMTGAVLDVNGGVFLP